jgi:hypothetical protein
MHDAASTRRGGLPLGLCEVSSDLFVLRANLNRSARQRGTAMIQVAAPNKYGFNMQVSVRTMAMAQGRYRAGNRLKTSESLANELT